MRTIAELNNIKGVPVLVRLDLDVEIKNGAIVDTYRIESSFKTLNFLKSKGAKLILLGHIGRDPKNSLRIVTDELSAHYPVKFQSTFNWFEIKKSISKMKAGEMILLENLRQKPEEKANDEDFAQNLASLGEIFINESFATAHREHASVVGLPKLLPSYFGFNFQAEVENLSEILNPEHPFLFIVGGAKMETKLPVIKKYLQKADRVFVGGALAHPYFKALGHNIGHSLCCQGYEHQIKDDLKNSKLILPEDVIVENLNRNTRVSLINDVKNDETIFDVGPQSLEKISKLVEKSKMIVWNGPLGDYQEGFDESTKKLGQVLAESRAKVIVGGGDTISALPDEYQKKIDFVSTGGGAMLDFLIHETLPGIEAIN